MTRGGGSSSNTTKRSATHLPPPNPSSAKQQSLQSGDMATSTSPQSVFDELSQQPDGPVTISSLLKIFSCLVKSIDDVKKNVLASQSITQPQLVNAVKEEQRLRSMVISGLPEFLTAPLLNGQG